jgi:hypothetical protein
MKLLTKHFIFSIVESTSLSSYTTNKGLPSAKSALTAWR